MTDPFIYREVKALLTARIPDTADADENPDRVPLNGYGTAHPKFKGGSVVFTEQGEFAIPRDIPVRVVDGHLMVEVLDGEDVVLQPLYLPVTVDERANQNWSYQLTFGTLTIGERGDEITHPPLSFPVEDGDGPLELSTVAASQVKAAGFITRGQTGVSVKDARRIDNARIEFLMDDGTTTQAVALGLGRDGANVLPTGIAIAQSIGQGGVARPALDAVIEQEAVTSPSVGRIVTSTDASESLDEGDVLLVYQGARAWTENFDDGLHGMTPHWNRRGDWDWATGAVVSPVVPGAPGNARKALSIDALGDREADVELLAEISPAETYPALHHALVLQGSGTAGRETGWVAGFLGTDLYFGKYNNGSFTSHHRSASSITAGTPQKVRARIDGGRIMVRTWPSEESEPASWTVDMDMIGGSRPGWYGLATGYFNAQRWERVAVATQGGTAVLS